MPQLRVVAVVLVGQDSARFSATVTSLPVGVPVLALGEEPHVRAVLPLAPLKSKDPYFTRQFKGGRLLAAIACPPEAMPASAKSAPADVLVVLPAGVTVLPGAFGRLAAGRAGVVTGDFIGPGGDFVAVSPFTGRYERPPAAFAVVSTLLPDGHAGWGEALSRAATAGGSTHLPEALCRLPTWPS